jgi:hypothetical protein
MNRKVFLLQQLLFIFFILGSCSSLKITKTESGYPAKAGVIEDNPEEQKDSGVRILEIRQTLDVMDKAMESITRDIDDPSWLMAYVSYLASKDLYIVESVQRYLKYSHWSSAEKKSFLEYYLQPGGENSPGVLREFRMEMLQDMKYLVSYSNLLKDQPWMMRDFFDEKSEFSYWYVMYVINKSDPEWVENTILPAMLPLIAEDDITPVSYLWLKNPDSLQDMDQEILFSGYPWTLLFHMIRISKGLHMEVDELYQQENLKPEGYGKGVLF